MKNVTKIITEDAAKRGFDVRIRDIAYALLRVKLNDELIAFTVVFGPPAKDNDVADYESLETSKFLKQWFERDLAPKEVEREDAKKMIKSIKGDKKKDTPDDALTFEENRAGIEKQIEEILELKKQLMDETGKVTDVKTMATLQKTEADLRSKLNDKFGASEKTEEQYILVQPKYDMVCPWTRHECYQMTKERAMDKWNLVERINDKNKQ